MAKSHLEERFLKAWESYNDSIVFLREHKPLQKRQFRLDFAHLDSKVGIEIHGAIWGKRSGHNSGTGLNQDYEKLNLIQSEGWIVFQLSENMLSLELQKKWFPIILESINTRSLLFKTS